MAVVTYSIQATNYTIDTYVDANNPGLNYGPALFIEVNDQFVGGVPTPIRGMVNIRIANLPGDADIVDMRMKLYHFQDNILLPNPYIEFWSNATKWSERDSTWNTATRLTGWTGGAGPDREFYLGQSALVAGLAEWVTFQLGLYVQHLAPKAGDEVSVILCEAGIGVNEWARFASRQEAANWPILEVDFETEGITDLTIAPSIDDRRRPKLHWTPLKGVNATAQKIYRQIGGGGWGLAATLGIHEQEWTDTTIDAAANDNQLIEYMVYTENLWCSGMTSIPSVIAAFTRPAVTGFWVSDGGGGEGVNIDVLEKVFCHPAAAGGTISKYQVDWDDGGLRWFDPALVPTPDHHYTTSGLKAPKLRAENGDGYRSNWYTTTGGHSAPNCQVIIPIADLQQFPTRLRPYQKLVLDASMSYDRSSNGTITNYTFHSDQTIYGLPGMPTLSPIVKAYFKSVFTANQHVHINATGGAGVSASYPVVVALETVRNITSLSNIDRATLTVSKTENVDRQPKIGLRSGDVIDTGASPSQLRLEILVRGTDAAGTMKTLAGWNEAGDLLDVPLYNNAGVVVQVYRCRITECSFDVRGGEPGARHANLTLAVVKRLTKVVDEAVNFVGGVGNVAHYPIADYDGDGDYTDDIAVRTAAGGGGAAKPVSSVDYVGDDPDGHFSEITLVDGAYNAAGYVTYWWEEQI